ncbi:MAG: hypothetical protein V3U76_18960 [Granulosicoccus sp.]
MVSTISISYKREYHWDWTEAFSKFGFGDGDGPVETHKVIAVLEELGCRATTGYAGLHNAAIVSVNRDGVELISGDVNTGYDNPREYLPEDLIEGLDRVLPVV